MMDPSRKSVIKYLVSTILLYCMCRSYTQSGALYRQNDGGNFITLSSETEYAVLSGDNVSLICGFNLTSRPSSDTTIIWQSPTGKRIKSDDPQDYTVDDKSDDPHDYIVDDGPNVVRLDITNADTTDGGLWNCTVENAQQQRTIALEIHLSVVSPPGRPLNLELTVESVSYSWVIIQWQAPNDLGSHGISYYNITVYKIMPGNNTGMLITEISTESNETQANITGLQTGMSSKLYVAGVISLRGGNFIALGKISDPLLVNTSIEAPMPVCNRELRLITSNIYTTNVTLEVVWSYSQRERLQNLLSRIVLSYSIPTTNPRQVSTRTYSEDVPTNQTSKMITISWTSTTIDLGTIVVNITASNSQGSSTIMCPPLQLKLNVIQIVLSGVQDCSVWMSQDAIEKWQAVLSPLQGHIQNTCDGCEYTITNQAMECADKNSEIVALRAELLSPLNMTEVVLDSIRSWISTTPSIVLEGLRLNPKNNCSLVVQSFDSPLDCLQELTPTFSSSSNPPVTVTHTSTVTTDQSQEPHSSTLSVVEVLVIISFLGCGILTVVVLLLVLYIAYKHYKESIQKAQRLRNTENQQDELQIPMVNISRLSTTSQMTIPETIPECEFEECEKTDDFELSASLAYGAVESVTTSRLRPESDLWSIPEDLEHTCINPIYEGNPIYETIKVARMKKNLRPISSVSECESSDHS